MIAAPAWGTAAGGIGRLTCLLGEHPAPTWGVPGRQFVLEAKRLGLASPAGTDLAFAEAGNGLHGDHAGAAAVVMPFGPYISKAGCDRPAGGKSRRRGRHLDALVDQRGA